MISETLRTWLLGIIAAGMVIGVLYALLPKGRMKPIVHAAGGAALLLVIVQPGWSWTLWNLPGNMRTMRGR